MAEPLQNVFKIVTFKYWQKSELNISEIDLVNHEADNDDTRTHVVLSKGTMVQHYRIVEKIGAGGMGEVYLAEDTKLKRQVALKFLTFEQTHNNSVLQQFTKEAQAAARLQHPNIITVHEVNEYEEAPFISMAYIEGQTLKELSVSKSLPIPDIIELGIQISRGLTAAHEKGVTHRDLKPGNLMLDSSGTLKILDFGLAVLSDIESDPNPDCTVTSKPFANNIAGTISYMAPEQLLGLEISSRADIFAFGVILYELIADEHPFIASSASEISARILRDSPAYLYSIQPNVPYDLSRILSRCLAKKPEKRFQTARDVCNELEELADQLKQNVAVTVIDGARIKRDPTLCEKTFVLSTDLVRKLSHKDPKMIGSSLVYIDNEILSDALIIYLHGMGHDHRQFSDVLRQLPTRAIALSLFGFDNKAQLRIPLTLDDHSILMRALINDVCDRLRPRHVILVGSSSGADHVLHCLSSEEFADLHVTGLLSLGCNIHFDDCFASSKLAQLTSGDDIQILSTINEFCSGLSSVKDWLILHGYFLTAFSKFGTETEPLRQYAGDIIAPFVNGDMEQFIEWHKNCIKRVPHVQFVVDTDGYIALDRLLHQHLKSNILGDEFHEDRIVRVPCSHIELGQTEWVIKQTLEFMKLLE